MPSRKSVKSIISRNHGLGKAKLTDILSSVSSVSLTTDIYTSDANDAYITITAHFLSASWEMKSFVLGTREFPGSHTGAATSEVIFNICKEFKIRAK